MGNHGPPGICPIDSGWKVKILPRVFGARGMVRVDLLTPALEFLENSKQSFGMGMVGGGGPDRSYCPSVGMCL